MLLQNGTHLEADSGLPVELLTEKLRSFSLFFPSPDHIFHSPFSFFFLSFFLWCAVFRFSLLFFSRHRSVFFFPIFVFVLINEIGKVFNKHFYFFFSLSA